MFSEPMGEPRSIAPHFFIPAEFSQIYPCQSGRVFLEEAGVICKESAGLIALIRAGTGQVRLSGKDRFYAPDGILCVPDAAEAVMIPAEKTDCLYLLTQNGTPLFDLLSAHSLQPLPTGSPAENQFMQLWQKLCADGYPSIYPASAELYSLMMELCAAYGNKKVYRRLTQAAIRLIRRDYAFLSGVDGLAEALSVSKSHLIRTFTAETGLTPGHFLQRERIEAAKLLLLDPAYTVEMVADMTGYAGATYFCRVFRAQTGESPGEYRAHTAAPIGKAQRERLENLEKIHYL